MNLLPYDPMWWLWLMGPLVTALVYLLTSPYDKRRVAAIERWRSNVASHRGTQHISLGHDPPTIEVKRVPAVPSSLRRILMAAGGGQRVDAFELVPKLAYLAIMAGDALSGSDHQTVVAKLDEPAPTFLVRPLAILDGRPEINRGVQFKKDSDFMESFIVERTLDEGAMPTPTEASDKAIRRWLSPPVRAALLELPDAWLRVEAKTMAFTCYGRADAERLHEVVVGADLIFAEHGADGGPSLLGDDAARDADGDPPPPPLPPQKKSDVKQAGARKVA